MTVRLWTLMTSWCADSTKRSVPLCLQPLCVYNGHPKAIIDLLLHVYNSCRSVVAGPLSRVALSGRSQDGHCCKCEHDLQVNRSISFTAASLFMTSL